MMPTASYEENRLASIEHRTYDCHVWQVGAACHRMIREYDFSLFPRVPKELDLVANCFLHGTQVNRQMRGIGHQVTLWVEEGTGEVQTLLDIR